LLLIEIVMKDPVRQVAIAILYQNGQYLLQLRDPLPTIVHPGHWGLFGGHLDDGETPEAAIWRELAEEIGYTPPSLTPFCEDQGFGVVRHVFYGPLTVPIQTLTLQEGWDFGLLTPAQISQGAAYSAIAQQVCPIGTPHQAILLNFFSQFRQSV
jgi:8-oxo-dGTP pyrophosphatase MutT (NUDIX family)